MLWTSIPATSTVPPSQQGWSPIEAVVYEMNMDTTEAPAVAKHTNTIMYP